MISFMLWAAVTIGTILALTLGGDEGRGAILTLAVFLALYAAGSVLRSIKRKGKDNE